MNWQAATFLSLSIWMLVESTAAQELVRTPTETKALYTVNIAQHSTWPNSVGTAAESKFVIGTVGEDPNKIMDLMRARISSGKGLNIHKQPVEIRDMPPIGSRELDRLVSAYLGNCRVLFFAEDSQIEWTRLQPLLRKRPVLTMSELPGFVAQGGMVEFQFDKSAQRMYMLFNMRALREAGIVVSARLLALKISRPMFKGAAE